MKTEVCILNKQAFGNWYLQVSVHGEPVSTLIISEEDALKMIKEGVNHQG